MPCGGHLWNIKKQLYSRCVRLFQRQSAKFDPSNPVKWYDSVQLGHNSMWELMPSISTKLVYRSAIQTINHALRQCIFWIVLVISPIDIEWVSRQKSETSLKTYTGYNTASSIKRSMSDILDVMQQDWHEEQHPSSKCISDLRDRLSQVYHLATEAAQKARQKQKKGYDIKIRGAVIKQGDGVLVKVVSFDGRQMGTDPTGPGLKKESPYSIS